MNKITVVGGGLAGLIASIACAEQGAPVQLLEAHEALGGRARTSDPPYRANLGPHAIYRDGSNWAWFAERELIPPFARPPLSGLRFRYQGVSRRTPPLSILPAVLRLRGRRAPTDQDFRTWAAEHSDESTSKILSAAAGVFTFHHDPGALSAAFVWERAVRTLLSPPPTARYLLGGWSALVEKLGQRARELGVQIETSHAVDSLPQTPLIIATALEDAGRLLGDRSLSWPSGHTVCLDLGLHHRRGDPFVVSDLDEAGWIERYTAPDPSLAPDGEELIQAQMPIRPDESAERATLRLETLLDVSLPDWRERTTWRRRQVMVGQSGALEEPGKTWRDRPAIDRGDAVFLAGDQVAAPGLLSEVSWASATAAAELALAAARVSDSTPARQIA